MAGTTALDVVPLWALFLLAFVGMVAALEAGFRVGNARRRRPEHEKESPVGGMVAAELSLLGFLLAFAFGIAASRFDERRQSLLAETNSIGTTYLRAALLPEPQRSTVRTLLREYVDVRIAGVQVDLEKAVRDSEDLHRKLWAEAVAAAAKDDRSITTGLFLQSLNETIDLHSKRLVGGLQARIPLPVWIVLMAVAVLSFSTMGYQVGLSGATRSPAILVVALTFATVLWLVADLDRPREGLLRVSQAQMIDLRKSMTASPP